MSCPYTQSSPNKLNFGHYQYLYDEGHLIDTMMDHPIDL